ncbi:MAG: S-ribosylhomocysteine lyase [Candidatus Borkfalkia sp.]
MMEKIPSFCKDHDNLQTGLYLSTVQQGVSTFDLRMKTPNGGDYVPPKALHTIEHIIATILRNGPHKENIIYFGPMGCRTGFYLLTVALSFKQVLGELRRAFSLGAQAEIPVRRKKSGNYLEHDLDGARKNAPRTQPYYPR